MRNSQPEIVVGVDSTGALTAAVDWATRAAAASGGRLRILNGFSPDLPGFSFGMDIDADAIRISRDRMLSRVAAHAHLIDAAVPTETVQSEDYPAKLLVRASMAADLVVLGAQGDSHLGFSAIGQTAAQVASHAQSAVVIVRGGSTQQQPHRRVTVGVDLSPDAETAVVRAFDEAERCESELLVVHAWQPRDSQDPHLRKADWAGYATATEERVLESIAAQQQSHPQVKVTVQVTRANPTRILVDLSASSDLLVVGARGAGGFEGLRLGQVARDLLGHSHCTLAIAR